MRKLTDRMRSATEQLLAEAGYPGGRGLPPLTIWSGTTSAGGRGFWASLFGTAGPSDSEAMRRGRGVPAFEGRRKDPQALFL